MCLMKNVISASLMVLFSSLPVLPQAAPPREIGENLYSVALFTSLRQMEKAWGNIDDSAGNSGVRTDYRHVVIEADPQITQDLPSQQGDYRVEYLSSREQMERYKQLGKKFAVFRIHAMQSDGPQLNIHVSTSYFTNEKHKFLYELSDWSDVQFHYDCETQRFVVSGVKLGGI